METEKIIKVLNTLLEINNDRIEGYETASKETNDNELITLFAKLARTSSKCKQELTCEIDKLGGTPTESTKTTGKFFRAWMDVKAALTGNDRKAILSSCEFGEDHAVETYESVLKNDMGYLSAEQQMLVNAQYIKIKSDHDTVRSLRDTMVAAS